MEFLSLLAGLGVYKQFPLGRHLAGGGGGGGQETGAETAVPQVIFEES